MTFNYPNIGRNPMHNMMPLMNNLSNANAGNNIISQIAAAMNVAATANALPSIAGPQSSSPIVNTTTSGNSPRGALTPRLAPVPPSFNDAPLEFNRASNSTSTNSTNKSQSSYISSDRGTNNNLKQSMQMGAGPMDIENENENTAATVVTDQRHFLNSGPLSRDTKPGERSEQTPITSTTVADTGAQMFLNSMLHQGFMMMQPTMMMDPAAMALQMQQYSIIPDITSPTDHSTAPLGSGIAAPAPIKEIIHCKSCTLFPPNPTAPAPTIRERPPGCRTVFVGGLPEAITEDIIREIFETCGEITTLRLSKKNFCHIRFAYEASVDSAIYLSGYRIRILSNESTNCGRLHVDYAQARDDQYEWECKQRQFQREQRHRERLERDRLRSVSPPPVVHYTDHEASTLSDKLKSDDTFLKAVQTLIVWLERGDCSKKNANMFYSMIQSTNAHVRRLNSDKIQFEEELRKAREQYRKQMLNMSQQFTQIEKVFSAASHKKVWDHFTKAQRKNIDQWKKLSMEMRSVQIEDDEMEMSDDDRDFRSTSSKRCRYDNDNLKEENDSLRCQVEAFKNEITLVKSDIKTDTDFRDKQIKVLQETIRNMQTQLLENKAREKKDTTKIDELEQKLKEANVRQLLLKTKIVEVHARYNNISSKSSESGEVADKSPSTNSNRKEEDDSNQVEMVKEQEPIGNRRHVNKAESAGLDLDEARIISLTSTFLVIHPHGATTKRIFSYLQQIYKNYNLNPKQIELIMCKYPNLFKRQFEDTSPEEKRQWIFNGFSLDRSS